ncbi:Mg-chelatase subunit ChlD [Oikeobacillus pervagus]|uniref:Mg-chelatase subunit ChlD n=1 Tax=Oikeobacillus pervagus TaxID=1325931 RepID=A0AAJ1WJC1_9BACI|nr:VWA domain-containing protein [Oikeobacillus pervagus]MDQ0213976.1 Mg-chelatase subunit ChlD [Oikeobacillus pervagus]
MGIIRKAFSLILVMLIIVGCSNETTKQPAKENKVTDKQEVEKQELDYEKYTSLNIEDMLKTEPGKYRGASKKEEKIKKAITTFPKGKKAEEYYGRLLALAAEDYRDYAQFFNNFDTSFEEISETPDEKVDLQTDPKAKKINVQILFDASGSMAAEISGEQKMKLAKDAVLQFVTDLPENVHVSLRVYGHKGTGKEEDKAASCSSTEVVYPLSTYDQETFSKALDTFKPAGWTPLAASISAAKEDLHNQIGENVENIIYIVSDGIETCGGDPVQAAKELNQSDIKAVINIIGFDVDHAGQKALKLVADAGKGEYVDVNSKQAFADYFNKKKSELLNEWHSWQTENVNKYYDSQNTRVNELYTKQNEMVNLATEEQNELLAFTNDLKQNLDLDSTVHYEIREFIRKRGYTVREYARDSGYKYREELRNRGYELREEVRDKGYKEREEIRRNK